LGGRKGTHPNKSLGGQSSLASEALCSSGGAKGWEGGRRELKKLRKEITESLTTVGKTKLKKKAPRESVFVKTVLGGNECRLKKSKRREETEIGVVLKEGGRKEKKKNQQGERQQRWTAISRAKVERKEGKGERTRY